jgi:AcrR family transcriptional regulator
VGLRDSKKLLVREQLASAAIKLFAARGFDAVTVDEIVGAVNVSRRSFFRYFPTKEAAFFARRADQTQRLEALLSAPLPGEGPFETVRRALLLLADEHVEQRTRILVEHKVVAKAPALLARDLELDRAASIAIASALARGSKAAATLHRGKLAAAALIGVLRVVIEDWVATGAKSDLRKSGANALAMVQPLFERSP